MALDILDHCTFTGPALPEPYVRFELEGALTKRSLLPKATGRGGAELAESWSIYRRKLRELVARGGSQRVLNHVIEPLLSRLGYATLESADEVETREGRESGGWLLRTDDGAKLRVWAIGLDEDFDAPARRGAAYRYSAVRIAQRVLLAVGERLGLITNGVELRLLLSDPARPDSQITIPIDPHWKRSVDPPESFRLLLALGSPKGVAALPDLIEAARLQQTRVTRELRRQAREAVEQFVQEVLDHPANRAVLAAYPDKAKLAHDLWHEGLILVYRLLFVLKLESSDDPARSFSFASTSLWRTTYSPSVALARHVRASLDHGSDTGRLLEDGIRTLFRMFSQGLESTELRVEPLGGALFGEGTTPILARLIWGERAVAKLLDRLLWTPRRKGSDGRERVHYGPLDVEDLGRVYEALLELDPGIATQPMCRLRRQKLEVVMPVAQGERYRPADPRANEDDEGAEDTDDATEDDGADEETPRRGKTKVEWIEEIAPGRFYLRVGLGRKASGSYYTPHSFVRFLVQETLGPQVAARSPQDDPQPAEILLLKVLDPAMGSGHFLVEACRFLAGHLYEAVRLCDEKALDAERRAEQGRRAEDRKAALAEATRWRSRIEALPDPDDELLRYLPSRAPEGEESGLSQRKAQALCRRLIAVHCLYGVDRNPLAVELAKLSLWIESHAEGLPLTFLDHRLVLGDSLTGPFFERLLRYPGNGEPLDDLFTRGLRQQLTLALEEALKHVRDLEATVGASVAEIEAKESARRRLERALAPFKVLAAAWAGGVMLGDEHCDDTGYAALAGSIAKTGRLPADLARGPRVRHMIALGLGVPNAPSFETELLALLEGTECIPSLCFDLTFPEVFHPRAEVADPAGFDTVLGNPPWDAIQFKTKEFLASFDFEILSAPTKRERTRIEERLTSDPQVGVLFEHHKEAFEQRKRTNDTLYVHQKVSVEGDLAGRQLDEFRVFLERNAQLLGQTGRTGVLVPSAFHANEGATGIRRLYLEELALQCCFSFENRRKLFEIHSSFKFALVAAARPGPTTEFPCAFYLQDDEWLFGDRGDRELSYTLEFIRNTGGEYLTLLEPRAQADLTLARHLYGSSPIRFGEFLASNHITPNTSELPMLGGGFFTTTEKLLVSDEDPRDPRTADSLLAAGYIAMHEGKTFWQYDDHWESRPRYAVEIKNLQLRPRWIQLCRYFRLVYREVSSSTNERTGVFCILPPPHVTARNAASDITPSEHSNAASLRVIGLGNSFVFDYLLRLSAQTHVTLFMVARIPIPPGFAAVSRFVGWSALRLLANHRGYAFLWNEQLGTAWRESTPAFTWPVLSGDEKRWGVRAALDAVVAHAYGVSRDQYERVLGSFDHATYPQAPAWCIERFDELLKIGLAPFCKKHDPYWDIPMNEALPQPVIDLPGGASQGLGKHLVERSGQVQLIAPEPGPLFEKPRRKGKP